MNKAQLAAAQPDPSKQEVTQAALAWAEFLYDEFMLKKHKQLLLDKRYNKIEVDKQGGTNSGGKA